MGVGQAEPGSALQVAACLGGIAGFGIALSAQAQLPGFGVYRQVPRQADLAAVGGSIGKGETDGDDIAEGAVRVVEGAELTRRGSRERLVLGEGDIRGGLVSAFQAADPFGDVALVVVTVAG